MIDLTDGREMEEDPRHIMTDPLDPEDKLKYENHPNPFIRNPKNIRGARDQGYNNDD